MSTQNQKSYQAPALEKGLDILEFLASETISRSQGEIADALGRKQSELYRMLACLERRGYVRREGNLYSLTLRMYKVGRSQQLLTELRRAARVPMERLAHATGQSCHLSIQQTGELLVILERMPARKLCLSVGEGSTFPLWRTASGKVLLGMISAEERETLLTQDSAFNELPDVFQERARQVAIATRSDGYLAQVSDMTEGVFDVAVPIGIAGGESAVLALSCLESPETGEVKDQQLLEAVQQCAEQIDINLGLFIQSDD